MRLLAFLTLVFASVAAYGQPPVQLVSPAKEAVFRQAFPTVDNDEIHAILTSPDLVFYTEEEMPKAYQNANTFHSPYYNISGEPDRFGNGNREFPWGIAGGTHTVRNIEVFRFVKFPRRPGGGFWPMVYFNQQLPAKHRDGNSGSTWRWMYPDGTVFGELLGMREANGYTYPFELRLRIREGGNWAVDCYRPFPTAADLVDRIQKEPNWQDTPSLSKLVQHLEGDFAFAKVRLRDRSGKGFDQTSYVDVLPPINDPDLVARLLVETVWRSALAEDWRKAQNNQAVNAPTVNPGTGFHIVPEGYSAYAFAVDRVDCMQCHEHTNRAVSTFEFNRGWYGRIRGSDGILSFHPIARQSISGNGSRLVVQINPKLSQSGLAERFDTTRHPSSVYVRLDPDFYQEGQ